MSILLVLLQFCLIALLLLPLTWPTSPIAMALLAGGTLLGVWTLMHNRFGNFNIRPEPKSHGRLITSGPYRWVRHPMYDAVLLLLMPWAFFTERPINAILWIALCVVLWCKAAREEKLLHHKYPEYAAYAKKTGRLLPRLRSLFPRP